jgi:hypothetical protein
LAKRRCAALDLAGGGKDLAGGGEGGGFIFDIQALDFGQLGILIGIAIDTPEEKEIGETDGAGEGEAPAPSGVDENDADDGDPDGRGKFGSRVVERGCEAALALGKPEADGFGVCGKSRRLAYAEQEPRAEECAQIGRGGCGKGGGAPDEGADAPYAAYTELIEHDADGQLAKGIGPIVGAGKIAEDDIGDTEGGDQRIVGDGEIDAIEEVDQDADAEQPGDTPAAARNVIAARRISG